MTSIQTTTELLDSLEATKANWVQLTNAEKSILVRFNTNRDDLDNTIQQIVSMLENPKLPPDIYYIDARAAKNKPGFMYQYSKSQSKSNFENDKPLLPIETKKQTTIVTDQELLEIRVLNERLQIENEILKEENECLKQELEELQNEPKDLSDPGTDKITKIIEVATPILDSVLGMWKQSIETKQAEISTQLLLLQQSKAQPRNQIKENNDLTLDELESVRISAPYEFYNWLGKPGNYDFYSNLKNQANV